MTISRVEIQGQISRAQDFTTIKQNEDNKGVVNQNTIQREFNRSLDDKLHQVQQGDKTENQEKKFDAKEKGNGTYSGDGGQKRKKDESKEDGKVILKGKGSFDIKI